MVHFAHLVRHGFIVASESFEAHVAALAAELDRELDRGEERAEGPDVRAFLRPQGLDQPATPLVVEAIESLAGAAPEVERVTLTGRVASACLRPLLYAAEAVLPDRLERPKKSRKGTKRKSRTAGKSPRNGE